MLSVTWQNAAAQPELGSYLAETLRTFQGLTGFFRSRRQVTLTQNVNFYDLPTLFPSDIGYTVRDRELIGVMQYHLYEPYSPGSWAGSEMFTLTDLINALTRARNQFLDDTGIVLTRFSPFVVPAGSGLVDVGSALGTDQIIDIIRAQWVDASGRYYNVWRSDEIYADSFRSKWTLYPGIPYGFSIFGAPPLSLQLTPPNIDSGQLELIIIEAGLTLDPTANSNVGTLLSVPDNYSWVLKWGAMADLLSREGEAKDPARAELAKKMYALGVSMAMQSRVIINPELDGNPIKPDTLFALDSGHQGWQGIMSGAPIDLVVLSHNLIAVRPAPDSVSHSLLINMAVNAQVPVNDTDYIQIGREQIEMMLDYAEFLALFKMGASEHSNMSALLQRFIEACTAYNSKIAGAVRAAEGTLVQQRQRAEVPRRKMPRAVTGRI